MAHQRDAQTRSVMMESWITTAVGLAAAICTTASYIPQVKKTWQTQETGDLSLRMLLTLAAGLSLWCVYGLARADAVIILANGASLAMLSMLIYWTARNRMRENRKSSMAPRKGA